MELKFDSICNFRVRFFMTISSKGKTSCSGNNDQITKIENIGKEVFFGLKHYLNSFIL